MGARIDQFCEDLRQKLTTADSGLDGLKTKINGEAAHVEQDVQSHLDRVQKRVEQGRVKITAAQADIKAWADEKKAATSDKIAEWKAKRELSKLQGRADKAERYAAAASAVAVAAFDEAEEASLEAWLARRDANAAQAK
jgi:predicted  nucleic acid-binding Zn-ribbon protein